MDLILPVADLKLLVVDFISDLLPAVDLKLLVEDLMFSAELFRDNDS